MNILKPRNIQSEALRNKRLCDLLEDEKINFCNFEKEKFDDLNLYEIEFEHCRFSGISLQNGNLEKASFSDVIFEQCNFSNSTGVKLITAKFQDAVLQKTDY